MIRKKKFLTVCFIALLLVGTILSAQADIYYVDYGVGVVVYSSAVLRTPLNSAVNAGECLVDLSAPVLSSINQMFNEEYPLATYISSATAAYNCHSYAWHNSNYNSNNYWVNDPSAYITDGSYIETNAAIGAIVVYYDFQGQKIHSGVVTEIEQTDSDDQEVTSDMITVISKWGTAGLYEHKGSDCPYNNEAEEVRYYRNTHSTHTYTYSYEEYNDTYHKAYCSCGHYVTQSHVYLLPSGITSTVCVRCAHVDLSSSEERVYATQNIDGILYTENGSYQLPNGIIYLVPEDLEAYYEGILGFSEFNGDVVEN